MDIDRLDSILLKKIDEATNDLAARIETLRASAGRKNLNANAVAAVAGEIQALEIRLEVLIEIQRLTGRA